MDVSIFLKYLSVILREAWQRKFLCLLGFTVVSLVVLIIGMSWPSKFETTATLFADNQNILKPLLSNQAAQSKVQDQTKVVRDMILSPRTLKKVVEKIYGLNNFESAEELGQKSEYLHRALIESSDDYIFLLDANGTYVTSNDQVAHLGLDSNDQVVGKTIEQIYPKEVAVVSDFLT